MLKNIITSVITSLIVVALIFAMSPAPRATLGGFTNYDELELNSTASNSTTTLRMVGNNPSCIQMQTTSGSTSRMQITGTTTPTVTYTAGVCK